MGQRRTGRGRERYLFGMFHIYIYSFSSFCNTAPFHENREGTGRCHVRKEEGRMVQPRITTQRQGREGVGECQGQGRREGEGGTKTKDLDYQYRKITRETV